ncbi:vgrg protein [Clostridium sp.]|uniref:VgrG-related protein n=1 Tax=Clostridium sp. TaxID=1506 RepID=UPI001A4938B2|nr:vgrg protein [Clostridium sp.]MBK5240662.1 vgrg protein [Clostridium sp.]
MTLSANAINNILLKQYTAEIKNNNATSNTGTVNLQNEKEMQEAAFQTILMQMTDSSGNSMMAELMSEALSKQGSFSLDDSLGAISNFNSTIRGASREIFNDYTQGDNEVDGLGLTASKYESNVNPGTISNTPGDYGGKSYGAWQFSSKTGSLDSFINSLKGNNNELYEKLSGAKAKDDNKFDVNFDSEWTSIASSNKEEFLKLQHDCIKQDYYDSAAQDLKLKYGFDISQKSDALKESLFSTVVQHGVGGTSSLFSKINLNNSDSNIINDLYNERQKVNIYFKSSSAQVKQSVYNRFTKEKQDMLSMLNGKIV